MKDMEENPKSIFHKQLLEYPFPDGMCIHNELNSPRDILNYQVNLNPRNSINIRIQNTKNISNFISDKLVTNGNLINDTFNVVITYSDITSSGIQTINSWLYHNVLKPYPNNYRSYVETLISKNLRFKISSKKSKNNPTWTDILQCLIYFYLDKGRKCSICQKHCSSMICPNSQFDKDFVICSNPYCLNTFQYMFFLPDYISSIKDRMKFKIVVRLLNYALTSERISKIYMPRPNFIPENITPNDIPHLLNTSGKSIKEICSICSNDDFSDKDFYDKYPLVYMTLKFALINFGKMYFYDSNVIDKEQYHIEELYEVKYEVESSVKFQDDVNDYLFHGSPLQNWYSILSNGLKIPDNRNNLMINANAYGSGIYLSDSASYSLSYSKRNNKSGKLMIGVFQVAKPKKFYKTRSSQIYLIKKENQVKLRYLLVIQSKYSGIVGNILNSFNQQIKNIIQMSNKITHRKGSKRLMKEFAKLQKNSQNSQYQSEVIFKCQLKEEEQLNVWNVLLDRENIPKQNILYKQLVERNIDNIKMELTFTPKYPYEPPFVRIVYPRFAYRTGHITLGGSICMIILTAQGWSPILNVEKLLLQIKLLLIDGEAKLDPRRWNVRYNIREAKEAFKRMLTTHGW